MSTPNADWHYPTFAWMRRWCPPESSLMAEWGHVRRGYERDAITSLFGGQPEREASFIGRITGFYHDVAFSLLDRRRRRVLYALAAPVTLVGYATHRPGSRGTETAFAWHRP